MNQERSSELLKCDTAKVLLMFLVIIGHCCGPFASKTWFHVVGLQYSQALSVFSRFLNSFHIYTFTLISGYIYYYQKIESGGGRYTRYTTFIKNKVIRLIVPYIFVTIVWAIPFRVIFFHPSFAEIVRNFVFADSPEQLWFLLMLFWVFAIYHPFAKMVDRHFVACSVGILCLYFIGMIWDFTLDYFQFFKALRFILFFHLGYGLRKYTALFEKLKQIPAAVYVTVFLLVFAVNEWIHLLPMRTMLMKLIAFAAAMLLNTFGAISCFVCIQKCDLRQSRIVSFYRKYTMTIYLFHQQLVYLFTLLISIFSHTPYIVIPFCFVLTMAGSTAISILVLRWPISRFLVGVPHNREQKIQMER